MNSSQSEKFPCREWKQIESSVDLYTLGGTIEDVCRKIRYAGKGMKDPVIDLDGDPGGFHEIIIRGYVRKTKEEIEEFDKEREKRLKTVQKQKEAIKRKEIQQLKKLKVKYPDVD